MFVYPRIDPVAFSIGPLKVHWYGIMYIIGFAGAWLLAKTRIHRADINLTKDQLADFLFYAALGVLLGGRIGYMVFYNLPTLIHQPLSLFEVWDGGMSFHGGLLGVMAAMLWFGHKQNKSFFQLTDFAAPLVPIGLGAGRIGNFINGELWGRVTNVPWAMIYPQAGPLPRHPSEIYEFLGEGVCLFIIIWFFSRKPRPRMAVSGLFLLGYGCIRFTLEFFRQPDRQLGYIAFNWLTMGQILCIPMALIGICLLWLAYKRERDACNNI